MTSTATFLNMLGVNCHFNYASDLPYANVTAACAAINYLGVKNLRDSCQKVDTPAIWHAVMNATGAKFLNYMPEGSPASVEAAFALLPALYLTGCCTMIEGVNEPDDAYALAQGMSIAWAMQFQIDHLAPFARDPNHPKPLVNMSFGAGWTSTNNWQGDYDKVGDMSAYADYGNAHDYPNIGQTTYNFIRRFNGLAQLSVPKKPVVTSEIGWDENHGWTQHQIAKNVLQAAFASALLGNAKTYFYALYDDHAGKFGLMNADGTPKPAGLALHNLIQLLKLSGSSDAPLPSCTWDAYVNDQAVMLSAAGGVYWVAIWNEIDAPRVATVTFAAPHQYELHWPLSGRVGGIKPASLTMSVPVTDEVTLVRVV